MENDKNITSSVPVCVLNHHGKPLMPTTPRKARLLLEAGKARIVRHGPFFTIQLVHGSSGYRQPVKFSLDAGYRKVGFSATTAKKELLSGELSLLGGMSGRMTEKRMYRTQRRRGKRYRPPRFDNRRRKDGWLAPSVQHKLDSHLRLVKQIKEVLPVTETTVEVANFDIQKIKDPSIASAGYQQGEQLGFWNLREYILHRDHHECQNPDCKNRAKEKILEVHHLGNWKGDNTDRPANLITLCTRCHVPKNHLKKGFLHGWQPKLKAFRPETFMSTVRWRLVNALDCHHTYGYLTKNQRIALGLPKSHANDAFVIAGGSDQRRAEPLVLEQARRNNRSLEKFYDAKYHDTRTGKLASGQELFSGRRTRNKELSGENLHRYRGHKVKKGQRRIRRQRYRYQPKDTVHYRGKKYHVKGMQNLGRYIKLDGLSKPVKVTSISPVRWRKGICTVT
ncbi:MAG: RNA-guided endonuclease IscB [Candidatus Odinarchaeota archaeon]